MCVCVCVCAYEWVCVSVKNDFLTILHIGSLHRNLIFCLFLEFSEWWNILDGTNSSCGRHVGSKIRILLELLALLPFIFSRQGSLLFKFKQINLKATILKASYRLDWTYLWDDLSYWKETKNKSLSLSFRKWGKCHWTLCLLIWLVYQKV